MTAGLCAVLVVVVAPRRPVDGPRRADVVHVVTLELQRDLLEVVVVVGRSCADRAARRRRIEVVHHDRAAPQHAAEPPGVLSDRVERIHADAMSTGRIGPRLPTATFGSGRGVHVSVAAPRDEVGGLRREEAHDLPARSIASSLSPGGITTTAFPLIASLSPAGGRRGRRIGRREEHHVLVGLAAARERVPGCDVREHDAQRLAAHVPRLRARGRARRRARGRRTRSTAADMPHRRVAPPCACLRAVTAGHWCRRASSSPFARVASAAPIGSTAGSIPEEHWLRWR